MKPLLGLSLASFALIAGAVQAQIPTSYFSNTYSSSRTRGFYFQVPINFTVTGLQVPDETKKGTQVVAIYKLTAAPPVYSATVPVTAMFYSGGTASNTIVAVPAGKGDYVKGDWFAVLGACGPTSGIVANSYGAGSFPSSVLGQPITLLRCGMQINIGTSSGAGGMFSSGGSIARVRVFVKGQGEAVTYGAGSGSATPPTLETSDPLPPSAGKQAEFFLKPATPGMFTIGVMRSNIPTPIGTLLNMPFLILLPIAGGSTKFTIPSSVPLGLKVTFQAGQAGPTGILLTNGLEWTTGL